MQTMLCISQFEKIKEKYGSVASWAIWTHLARNQNQTSET